jgi:hypothetical protein
MPKRCPPGVLCIENITIVIILIVIAIVVLFLNLRAKDVSHPPPLIREKIIERTNPNNGFMSPFSMFSGIFSRPNYSYSNIPNDILMNPYEPPLRDDRYFISPSLDVRGGVPINIPTQSVDTAYRQVGILTRMNGAEMILPLMGRPLFTNRDKWNFYTMSDKNNMIKLPVTNKGKSCTNEYGCDNIYNGDSVYVEGYNDAFKATIYDNNVMRYLPFL